MYIYLARNLEKDFLKNDDKYIEIKRISINEAIEKCEKDFCSDITTIAILYYLKYEYYSKE